MSKRRKYQDSTEQSLPAATSFEESAPERKPNRQGFDFSILSAAALPLRIAGSLTFGIVLMTILLVILAWGTFIESEYGRAVANFALYGSRWFACLLALLAVNILCSVLLRFPWKRHHGPFLCVHAGILVLLLGSFLTWTRGQEGQITLPEGAVGGQAVKSDHQCFKLQIEHHHPADRGKSGSVDIPFVPGPFNWDDYSRESWIRQERRYFRDTLWLAMQWGRRDQGALPVKGDVQGVKFEVLDYYASSTIQPVPPLELSVLWKKTMRTKSELGEVREFPRNWERVKLDIKPQQHPGRMENRGTRVEMAGGERICFYVTTIMDEVEAFRISEPDKTKNSGVWGQLVLYYEGSNHFIDVETLLRETADGKRFALSGTGLELGDVQLIRRGPVIRFSVQSPDGTKEYLTLFPDVPEMNVQANVFGLYGTYWVAPEAAKGSEDITPGTLERLAKPRIDFLQGPDKRLYYRYWNGTDVVAKGTVPDAKEVAEQAGTPGQKPAFAVAPGTPDEAEFVLERFVPQDLPGFRIVALPVGQGQGTEQRAKLRVTIDGSEDVFWLRQISPSVVPLLPERDQVRYVHGKGRSVRILWDRETIDLGFGIFLKKFEQRSEPGTRMSSYYSSFVDFVDMPAQSSGTSSFSRSPGDFRPIRENVLIRMNQPATFQGQSRRYRIYQSACQGPYHPGDIRFQELYDGKIFPWEAKPRESIYMSTLSINDDPGRGSKYLGCFFLLFGIAWFFYRRSEI